MQKFPPIPHGVLASLLFILFPIFLFPVYENLKILYTNRDNTWECVSLNERQTLHISHSFFFSYLQIMRKREIQSFSLKLSDLKEYEVVRQERAAARNQAKEGTSGVTPCNPPPLVKIGPKTKQEVRERIGFKS